MKFINNPFDIVIRATLELYPDLDKKEILIQFDPDLRGREYGECGYVCFPEEGETEYLISISINIPFEYMPEILAHELAHIIVGLGPEEHGEEWEKVFDTIYTKCQEIIESDAREYNLC
ncbi:MAG: hypothetical protein GXY40_02280 [Syntrophomonadaceae bacterium]|nr:hypothetical protein [Syntrophomonadaceae bacterium]